MAGAAHGVDHHPVAAGVVHGDHTEDPVDPLHLADHGVDHLLAEDGADHGDHTEDLVVLLRTAGDTGKCCSAWEWLKTEHSRLLLLFRLPYGFCR